MAPYSENCPICNERVYGKQKVLKCNSCKYKYHTQCLDYSSDEIEFLLQSTFKCEKCIKKFKDIGDETPIRSVANKNTGKQSKESEMSRDKNNREVTDTRMDDSSISQENNSNDQIMNLIQCSLSNLTDTFLREIELLKYEIISLKEENKKLYNLLTNTRNVGQSVNTLSLTNVPLSDVTKEKVNEFNVGEGNVHSPPLSQENINAKVNLTQPTNQVWVDVVSRNSRKMQDINRTRKQNLNSVSNNTPKEKKKFMFGKAQIKDNLVCNKKKALFVTRFSPFVTEQDIDEIVKDLEIPIKCTKLKTKYDSYSSFHVEVNESDYQVLSNPDIWPKGIMIGPFYGKLKNEKDLKNNQGNEHSDQTQNGSG